MSCRCVSSRHTPIWAWFYFALYLFPRRLGGAFAGKADLITSSYHNNWTCPVHWQRRTLASNLVRGVGGWLNTSVLPPAVVERNHCFLVAEAGGDRVGCERWVLHARGCASRHYLLQKIQNKNCICEVFCSASSSWCLTRFLPGLRKRKLKVIKNDSAAKAGEMAL